jgi:hypothetical protein
MAGSIFRKYERRNVVHYGRARRAEIKRIEEKKKAKEIERPKLAVREVAHKKV